MASKIIIISFYLTIINAFVIQNNDKAYPINDKLYPINDTYIMISDTDNDNPVNVFDGVYTKCFSQFSYTCLQRKTLLYLKELNRLNEISVIGKYVTFVKLNNSDIIQDIEASELQNTEELSLMIDKAVNNFFDSHLIRFRALGKDVIVPNEVEEFVGRKRRKGGGGGHGGGDGGKKKMMMMAMMCMKMKLMVMLPAMMGMMGMMSFKGMMFSMMSFMISKMMLLMKILEKKGGGGGGGGDGGWAAGGGGAWMPAGGQDYGGGGGYDANGQWQSRSIIEAPKLTSKEETPIVSYVKPTRYNNKVNGKPISLLKNLNDEVIKLDQMKPKSRRKRGIIDAIQNAYLYWASKFLGIGYKKNNYPKYKIFNGVKYVYYPVRSGVKVKTPKELPVIKTEESKPVVIADDFNEGEIVEGPVEGRMIRKKFHKMKDNVNETVDDNPWE